MAEFVMRGNQFNSPRYNIEGMVKSKIEDGTEYVMGGNQFDSSQMVNFESMAKVKIEDITEFKMRVK